jgi:hypothetical protein
MSGAETLEYMVWLTRQALGFAMLLWPLTMAAIGFVICAWALRVRTSAAGTAIANTGWIRLFSPTLISMAILIFGTFLMWPSTSPTIAPQWPLNTIFMMVAAQVLLSIVIVWKARGYRLFASAIATLQLWMTLMAANVAGMAVTGNWI